MSSYMKKLHEYEDRAIECERLAKQCSDPSIREGYLKLAATWREQSIARAKYLNKKDVIDCLEAPDII